VLVQIGDVLDDSIVPEVFQVVIRPYVGQEDMNQRVAIVHRYPLGLFHTYDMRGLLLEIDTAHVTHALGYCLDLCGRVSLTDYEMLADGSVDAREVGYGDVCPFFLLYSLNDGLY